MAEPKLPKIEVITLEPPTNGLISGFSPIANPMEGAPGQYRYSFGTTTNRPGYEGHVAPAEIFGQIVTNVGGTQINSLPRAVAPHITFPASYNGSVSILGGLAGTAPRLVIYDDTPEEQAYHPITASSGNNFTTLPATGYWGEDCIFYNSCLGTLGTYVDAVFYSWNDSGQGNLGVMQYTGGLSYGDTYVQSNSILVGGTWNLSTGVPHRMCVGPDKILYITNGNYIASFDGTTEQSGANGTFNGQALFLGAGWIATDIVVYQDYIAVSICQMGSVYENPAYSKNARVILWDGASLDFNQVYTIDDWMCSSLKVINGLLYAFTQGRNETTKIKYLPPWPPNFQTIFELPTSYIGNAPLPNQVEYFNDAIMWASSVFQVIAVKQTANGYETFTPYYISDGTYSGIAVGFLNGLYNNNLFAGFQSGNGYEIIGVAGDGNQSSIVKSLTTGGYVEFRSRLIDIGYRGTIVKLRAYFSNFSSTSSMYVSLIPNRTAYSLDGSNNPTGDMLKWTIDTANHPLITTNFTATTAEKGGISIADISQFWLNFRFTNTSTSAPPPILRKLEIFVQETIKP